MKRFFLLILYFSLFLFCEGKGSLVMVGGALKTSNKEVYERFIELAGNQNAKIGIFPAASSKPVKYSTRFRDDLIKHGIKEDKIITIPIAVKDDSTTPDVDESKWIENSNSTEISEMIQEMTAVWFIGGDQIRIMQAILNEDNTPTLTLKAIKLFYENGGVLGGTSAGAAVMSKIVIGGGNSLGALQHGFTQEYDSMGQQEYGPVFVTEGLDFFTWGIIDQHFDRKARLGRLIIALDQFKTEYQHGFGIDENTALVVYNGEAAVIGTGCVTICDISDMKKNEINDKNSYENIKISILSNGDSFQLPTMKINISKSKYKTSGSEYFSIENPSVTGVFNSNSQLKNFVFYSLIDNKSADEIVSYCFDPAGSGFKLVFKKKSDTIGYWTNDIDGSVDFYSAVNVYFDLLPVQVQITE